MYSKLERLFGGYFMLLYQLLNLFVIGCNERVIIYSEMESIREKVIGAYFEIQFLFWARINQEIYEEPIRTAGA
jgi:hypothetical protein